MGGGTGGEGQIDGARRWCRNATAKSASNGTMKRVLPEHHFVTLEDKLFLNMGVVPYTSFFCLGCGARFGETTRATPRKPLHCHLTTSAATGHGRSDYQGTKME